MEANIRTHNTRKDYWYLDRKRFKYKGWQLLLTALAMAVVATCSACGGTDATFQQQYEAAYGDSARGTSGLVSTVTSTVTSTLSSTLTSQKWYIDCGVVPIVNCPLTSTFDGKVLSIKSAKGSFDKAVVFFTDRSKADFSLNAGSFSYTLPKGKTLDGFMVRLKADGSKWFFDSGKWFVDVDSARWYGDCDSANIGQNTQSNDDSQVNQIQQ